MTKFGFNIKKLRESRGLSLSKVEEKLGITKGLISRYENNIVDPSLSAARGRISNRVNGNNNHK